MAETMVEIVSKVTIKPSSPTPNHLRHYKLSLLDEIAPPPSVYVPIVLFYSASQHDFPKMSQKLKTSLSENLTLYYPFCGRIRGSKGNPYVDCNDRGVLYLEARVPSKLSHFLKNNTNQQLKEIKGFIPLDPYQPKLDDDDEDRQVMAVQVTEFGCGGIAIGVCISHKVCDGKTVASFLQAWSQKAMGEANDVASSSPLNTKGSLLFPPKGIEIDLNDMIGEKNITTKRFMFSENSLCRLKEEISRGCGFNPTRVEAVTTLIWKSAMEAAKTTETSHKSSSFMLHAVNIRGRMLPPLPENSLGNLFAPAISPVQEVDEETKVELQDLAQVVRNTIKMVDGDYVRKLQGDDAQVLIEVLESYLEKLYLVTEKDVPCYTFTSWLRLGFYEINFGWGKPTWVCTIGVAVKNVIMLMPAFSSGDGGIEAWVTLDEHHMPHFESNPLLLQFVSFDP